MSAKTKIQWCDSTCNPTMGCEGCELWNSTVKKCYAGTLHNRFGGVTVGYAPTFENVTKFPGRTNEAAGWSDLTRTLRGDKPWLNNYPRLIFVSDMSDALSRSVEFEYLNQQIIQVVTTKAGGRHQWLWLTKRPERMAHFSKWLLETGTKWPANLWAGTSITNQKTTSRIRHLLQVGDECTIRFLSVEPQYEDVHLAEWLPRLDWVIQGGESGFGARPFDINWARSLAADCKSSGVAYFLKQLGAFPTRDGERLNLQNGHGGDWEEWPKDIRLRQLPALSLFGVSEIMTTPIGTSLRSQAAIKAWKTRRANECVGRKHAE